MCLMRYRQAADVAQDRPAAGMGPGKVIALTKQLLVRAADSDLATATEWEALAQGAAAGHAPTTSPGAPRS